MLTAAEMKRLLAVIANDKHSEERRGLELISRLGVHYYNSEDEIDRFIAAIRERARA